MRAVGVIALAVVLLAGTSAQITPAQNFKPTNITASSAPFDIIATPITPNAPYSQRAYQCNVSGDSRFPGGSTFPLNIKVPIGQRVRVIFANGNLNGNAVTQQGEPGVIVQQSGSPIVQQAGGASPIVQPLGSPVVQQRAPPAAMVVQQTPTVVQQNTAPQAPTVVQQPPTSPVVQQPPASPVVQQPPASPVVQQPPASPVVQSPPASPVVQSPPASPVVQSPPASPVVQSPPASPVVQSPPASPVVQSPPASPVVQSPPASPINQSPPAVVQQPPSSPVTQPGRKLLQGDRVPGGPNNGLVEYIAQANKNNVPGFVVPNTQFGVPYVEFTASAASAGQTATFQGLLEVAVVVNGVPQVPFRPNPSLSPECQVNVNLSNA